MHSIRKPSNAHLDSGVVEVIILDRNSKYTDLRSLKFFRGEAHFGVVPCFYLHFHYVFVVILCNDKHNVEVVNTNKKDRKSVV